MIRSKALEFQADLKKGMSIDEACKVHGVSFRDAVMSMPQPYKKRKVEPRKPKTVATVATNILFQSGKYYLAKNINKRHVAFGVYYTLEDAVKVRDYCRDHGWKQRKVDEYCRILGVTRVPSKRSKVRYH